ncbi:hypothetical protein RYX51_22930 (plasmid) [Priestia filamentosa]|nr:hypothetical protein RYX51_22930 [Priestia filamentosa]
MIDFERVEKECKFLREQLRLSKLSKAEKEVFALDGHSSSEMEKILFKDESAIKMQRRSIMGKLHVSSMQEAVQKIRL